MRILIKTDVIMSASVILHVNVTKKIPIIEFPFFLYKYIDFYYFTNGHVIIIYVKLIFYNEMLIQ